MGRYVILKCISYFIIEACNLFGIPIGKIFDEDVLYLLVLPYCLPPPFR